MSMADILMASPAAQKTLEAFDEANKKRVAETESILKGLIEEARRETQTGGDVVARVMAVKVFDKTYLERVLESAGHIGVIKHAAAVGGLGIVRDIIDKFESRVRGKA